MSMQNYLRPFFSELRKRDFNKISDSRAGGCRVVVLHKQLLPNRFLELQLWGEGPHRVTFWHEGKVDPSKATWNTTLPTEFSTLDDMTDAIRIETEKAHAYKL